MCVQLAFGVLPRRMQRLIQRFGKHCSCHFQGERIVVRRFWKLYSGQAVCGELDFMELFGGAEEDEVTD